jgi:hypothetical protein
MGTNSLDAIHLHAHCLISLESSQRSTGLSSIRVARRIFDDSCRVACHDLVRRHVLCNPSVSPCHSFELANAVPFAQLTLVTTLPAPTVEPFPILTPGKMTTLPPIQQSSSIHTSLPSSGPVVPLRTSGSSGCVPL